MCHYPQAGIWLFFSNQTNKVMTSLTGISEDRILAPELERMHKETSDWLSSIKLWQKELSFFQTILDGTAHYFTTPEDKKKVSRFQNLIIYYHAEVLPELRTKLRNHESHLGELFTGKDPGTNPYYGEHPGVMGELEAFSKQFAELKNDFFKFIEKLK